MASSGKRINQLESLARQQQALIQAQKGEISGLTSRVETLTGAVKEVQGALDYTSGLVSEFVVVLDELGYEVLIEGEEVKVEDA